MPADEKRYLEDALQRHQAEQSTPRQMTPADHLEQRRAELLGRQESAQVGFEHHARERAEHGRWCEVLELELASIRAALDQLDVPAKTEAPMPDASSFPPF